MTTRPPAPPYPNRPPGAWQTFAHAWRGLVHTVVHQPNMRVHVVAATLVALVGSGIPLGLAEKVTLIFCVLFVFFAEILNSALEQLVDLAIQQFDEKARLTKDAAAAGVLVLAIGTVVIFAALLVHNWDVVRAHEDAIVRQVTFGVPLVACVAFLMSPAPKPVFVEVLLGIGAVGLWAALLVRSTSVVFSALALGLIALSANAAWMRRREMTAT